LIGKQSATILTFRNCHSLWTVNVGYGREEIANAVRDQLLQLNFFSHSAANIPAARLAERLVSKMPGMSRVYYSSTGSEAHEKAFKMVRLIAHQKYGGNKHKILFRERDYHGSTVTTLSATGQPQRRAGFGPFTPGFVQVPHCCEYRSQWGDVDDYGVRAADAIEGVILAEGPDTVGALCLESITAGGGAIVPPSGYWERVQEICTKYKVLLIVDEVVMGVGRTGKWFGYQHYDIQPDIVILAKGLASGYSAISCTVTTEEVFDMCHGEGDAAFFRDISTFAACTAGPAAALANILILEREQLLENASTVGLYMQKHLNALMSKHAIIGDVRGLGLFAGVELVVCRKTKEPVPDPVTAAVIADMSQQGVMIGQSRRAADNLNNVLLLAPALVATKGDIDVILAALDLALGRLGPM
jgi:taurine-pyruvate aminotransferase